MIKKLIAIATSAALLLTSFVPAVMAEEPAEYDVVIYSNDFESAPAGAGLSESDINYRPENAVYEIVQEGDNKYYSFSPSDTSKRANSGNLETGYFLPATLVEKPIRKVKVDMDIAVDVKDGGPATISSYFRGNVANGDLNTRYNFVEFSDTEYYAYTDKSVKQAYTAGDWIHFTIYADYENNLASIYTDDGFAMENIKLSNKEGVDKFSQIRMTMETGESLESSVKLDNITYSTTAEVYEQIKEEETEPPVMGEEKPADYSRVLIFEDYEGDTTPDETNFEWKPNAQISIVNGDPDTVSAKEQGSFVKVAEPTKLTDSYYRVKYGAATAPVQAAGVTVADLSQMQISLDLCPLTAKTFGVRFLDKFSGSSTKGETLINVNKDGYLAFTGSDVKYNYNFGEWMAFDVFLDFTSDTYSVYINGSAVVTNANLSVLSECVEAVGVTVPTITEGETYSMYIDNVRIAIPGKFEVVSTTPSDGAIGVGVTDSVQLELSDAPVNFDESMVTVTGGTTAPTYTVTGDAGIISIDFDGDLEYSTQYTVTLSGDIADAAGKTLGEDTVIKFTTASAPSTPADYDSVIYTNDFENAPVGAGLSESDINYRPENANYEIVQEGGNKYYKFSPSDTGKRANSGNLETGYFLPATLAQKPIRKVKIDMDIAVDVKDGGPATISSYYRGRVANGALNSRYNFVEFTADKYYAATDKLLHQSYTPGDWVHFTIYADYESNLVSVYSDDGFAMENIPLAASEGVDKFSQVRMTMETGEGTDSYIKLDNIVYTTTSEIYEQIKQPQPDDPDEPPVMGSDKPYDYNRVLFFEDYEDDTAVSGTYFEWKPAAKLSMETSDNAARGSYVKISEPTELSDSYYRVKYGADTAPVQASGAKLADLSRMQVSLDLCPLSAYGFGVRFLDKFSDPAATKGETLISVNKDGYLTFAGSKVTYNISLNKWISIDVFLDFASDTYTAYINGNKIVENVKLSTLTTCVEAVGVTMVAIKSGETYSVGMDNVRIAIPEKMAVAASTPANGASNANVTDDVQITLTNAPVNFDKSMVTATAGTSEPAYTVTCKDNVVSVAFDGIMEFGTQYTVTLDGDIADSFGQTLGSDYVLTFTTGQPELTASVPEFGSKVTASAVNPYDVAKTAALVVAVINADGTVGGIYTAEASVAAGTSVPLTVDFDAASLTEGQTAVAFVADGAATLNPIRDVYATPDSVYAGTLSGAATVTLDKAELTGNTVAIGGKISVQSSRNLVVKLMAEDNTPAYITTVQTNEKGEFACSLSIANLAAGKYIASVTGYNMEESGKLTVVYLSDDVKDEIKDAINGAKSAAEMKAVVAKYTEQLNLDAKLLVDNTYNTLYEQLPYESYDKAVEMIYNADSLLNELNSSDWSTYSALFAKNEDIMLKGASRLGTYNGYSANAKNAVNKIITESSPFADFAALRTAFDNAVDEYIISTQQQTPIGGGSGGGGGGGGGGASSSYNVGSTVPVTAPSADGAGLFTDMSAAVWAQASVTRLYSEGIVSAAASYRPLDNVTREEFVKMLVQLAGLQTGGTADFTDVNGSEWYAPYLAAAQNAGIIKGSDDGSFGVGKNITRQDMVVMAQRAVAAMNKTLKQVNAAQSFADSGDIAGYASAAVSEMQQAGVVSGMGNGCFEPAGLANRAQAAVVICNLIDAMQ